MPFRLLPDESVQAALQRIAREQIDKAIGEIEDNDLDRHEAVHQVRKRCKKLRGLIRLVRPQFEDTYARENACYRDSARPLSHVRDAQSIIETFDKLADRFEDQIDRDAFSPVRRRLTERKAKVAQDEVGLHDRLDEFRDRMHQGRDRVAAWRINDDGFDALEAGLIKTYARGTAAMKTAYNEPSTDTFHQWRKRAKYHWYHLRLLRPIWNGPISARRDEADLLSDQLGDDHDLSILRDTLLEHPDAFGPDETVQALLGLITQRQGELRHHAHALGSRLYAEKPKRFAARLRAYWTAWHTETRTAPNLTHAPHLVTI